MCVHNKRDIKCARRASAFPGEREVGRVVAAGLREKKAVAIEEDVAQRGVILSSTLRGWGHCSAGGQRVGVRCGTEKQPLLSRFPREDFMSTFHSFSMHNLCRQEDTLIEVKICFSEETGRLWANFPVLPNFQFSFRCP